MDILATSDDGNYRVIAGNHPEPESPRWGAEMGTMVCAHPNYTLGDEGTPLVEETKARLKNDGLRDTLVWLADEHGVKIVLPLYLYDHGGITMRPGTNLMANEPLERTDWDTSLVGIIFAAGDAVTDWLGDVETWLAAEVSEYARYLEGEVYLLSVQQKVREATGTTLTYPDGRSEVTAVERDVWLMLPDTTTLTAYGSEGINEMAHDLLMEVWANSVHVDG